MAVHAGSGFAAIIDEYYRRIDQCDVDWVAAMFAADAVYERADSRLEGQPQIARFFREERLIRGKHLIERIWADEPTATVFAVGKFQGQGAEGDPRAVGFSDIWQFNADGLVRKRRSYLALGHDYVRR